MIFVTVGTHERPFLRLFREIERLIAEGRIKEEVICQTGFTKYEVKGAKCRDYYPEYEMQKYLETCRIMITHGGLGSIIKGVDFGKPVIAVPRMAKFGEHTDDHQLQIVKEMEKEGRVIAVYDISGLWNALQKAKTFGYSARQKPDSPVFSMVTDALEKWSKSGEKG
ncbi:MAG: PssE/Cps14G family polysaccharide biosynthesis glycosyltransferase [Candidatus Aenigmatarchaeota archaeon]